MNSVGHQREQINWLMNDIHAPRTRQLNNGEVKLEGKLDSWLDARNTRTLFSDE